MDAVPIYGHDKWASTAMNLDSPGFRSVRSTGVTTVACPCHMSPMQFGQTPIDMPRCECLLLCLPADDLDTVLLRLVGLLTHVAACVGVSAKQASCGDGHLSVAAPVTSDNAILDYCCGHYDHLPSSLPMVV